jgi:hypothetical protein
MFPIVVQLRHADVQRIVTGKIVNGPMPLGKRQLFSPDVLERPKTIALQHAMWYTVNMQERGPLALPVSVYCESDVSDKSQQSTLDAWNVIRRNEPSRMGVFSFVPGKTQTAGPLHAADMLAWHLNVRARDPSAPDDPMWDAIGGPDVLPLSVGPEQLRHHVAYWNS